MVAIAEQTEFPGWYQCLAEPAEEFPLSPLTVLEGAIPEGLQGSLYRNGPGRSSVVEQRLIIGLMVMELCWLFI